MLAGAHKEFYCIQHPEIYLLDRRYNISIKLNCSSIWQVNMYFCTSASLTIPFTVANVKLTTVKDQYPFITVQCVSGNYKGKIEEFYSQYQTFFTN